MKTALVGLCVLCVLVMGLQCPPGDGVSVTIIDEAVGILVVEVEGGIEIENLSGVGCTVYVRSPEGEQQFDMDVGEVITVTGITAPIQVRVVGG